MNLLEAQAIASRLILAMAPHCRRIEVAGSIRREKPEVKDIEIVAIPLWEPVPAGLFGETTEANRLHDWANSEACEVTWIKPGTSEVIPWQPKADGKYWRGWLRENVKLDLFLATEINWGAIMAIRTGCADFSHALVSHAPTVGKRFKDGYLCDGAGPLTTPEEADVFRLLQLEYIQPAARVDARAVRRLVARR